MYKSLKDGERAKQLTESVQFQAARTLDSEIERLLADKSIPASKKAQMYAQLVKQFQGFSAKAPEIQKEPEPVLPPSRRNIPEKADWKEMSDYYIEDEPWHDIPSSPIQSVSSVEAPEEHAESLRTPTFATPREQRLREEIHEEARAVSPPLNPYRLVYDDEMEDQHPAQPLHFAAVGSPVVETSNVIRQQRVDNLKEQLRQAPEDILSFDKNTRQLMVFGHKMPGSNIDKILSYVSNHRPPEKEKPQDVGTFLETYGAANLDIDAIPNKKLRQIAAAALPRGHGKRILHWESLY